ncbi:tetratricopeptide repeat protein [Anaeromyxobacter dehalogenans 2CP-1]|uniref:Tetratricopeptide repeat protein n=1 Tax=Anaeromyxobacter dehalogenans (strain ATCC BAA-258 / DSM 21875 / 2CP-1) TaxID=455488 RepID=B8J9F9_ANAD2|nr:tetratricopeptide repeat protein [Anaeromyxobacter dehalogenans]ACL67347.1 tetratricopeptide repeat protein [Anaeromyxobacter dehalogenans 2CP-1]
MTAKETTNRILGELRRAYQLAEEQRAPEALEIYRGLIAEARQAGLDSAHLHWACAVAADYTGELEMAFEQITTAIAKDPLAPPFRHSFDLISRHLRAALADPERDADDPSTPRLYALLQRSDEADVGAHLAMARFHLAKGHAAEARAMLDAVTLLHPAAREAWELLGRVAREAGDAATAERARLEASALGDGELPFAIPGPASA